MKKFRKLKIGLFLLFLLIVTIPISRPSFWRAALYLNMFDACGEGNIQWVKIWLFLGASPDGWSDYKAASGYIYPEFTSHVSTVVLKKNSQLLELLLAKGASPNLREGDGTLPLQFAIDDHKADAVRMLLNAGANLNIHVNPGPESALEYAKYLKFDDLIPVIEPFLKKRE